MGKRQLYQAWFSLGGVSVRFARLAALAGPLVGVLGLGHLLERRPEGRGWLKFSLIFVAGAALLLGWSFTIGLWFWFIANDMTLLTLPLVWLGAAGIQASDFLAPGRRPPRWVVHVVNVISPGSCFLWDRPSREHMALALIFMLVGAATMSVVLLAGGQTIESLGSRSPNDHSGMWRLGAASTLVYLLLAIALPFKRRWALLS